jgi:hypothetical protein
LFLTNDVNSYFETSGVVSTGLINCCLGPIFIILLYYAAEKKSNIKDLSMPK